MTNANEKRALSRLLPVYASEIIVPHENIRWDGNEQSVTVVAPGSDGVYRTLVMWINQRYAEFDGRRINIANEIGAPAGANITPIISAGRTFVPVGFILNIFDIEWAWDPHNEAVAISQD